MGSNFNKEIKGGFSPISLTELNATASLMERKQKKFLLTEQQFIALIPELQEKFYVLEIAGNSVFDYDNVYMDSLDYDFYKQHQAGKKSRSKVRTREYMDSGIAFFEYKQKKNKLLRKFRYPIDLRDHGKVTAESKRFYQGISMSFYGMQAPKKISPSLRTEYNRLTLCSKDSSERLTIDFDIVLSSLRGEKTSKKLHNVVIVESKSIKKSCESHKIMKKHGIEKTKGCSKYCIGLIKNGVFTDPGRFKKSIKKIDSMS